MREVKAFKRGGDVISISGEGLKFAQRALSDTFPEKAVEATDKLSRLRIASRNAASPERNEENKGENSGGAESVEGSI